MTHRPFLPPSLIHLLLAAALGLGAWPAAAQQAPAASARQWSLPAGPLGATLLQIAQQSGQSISVPPELVRGLDAPAIQGPLTPEEAAATALANTSLELVRTANGTLSVRARPAAADAAAPAGDPGATLAPVTVQAEADRSGTTERTGVYTPRATRSATRMPLSLRETPQSVTVVTAQQIEDRGITGLAQAMDTTTGVRVVADMARPTLYSRGLAVSNLQIDGNPMFPVGQAMTGIQSDNMIAYDRIEVLRGANGLLTGPGDPSGSVTLVRKRATREFQAHVQGGFASWGNRFGDADVSGPLNDSGTVRGRVAVGAYGGGYYIDGKGLDGAALLATVEADLAPRTVARIGYQDEKYVYDGYSGGTTVPLWYSNGLPYDAPRSLSNTPHELKYDHRTRSLFVGLEHAFGNGWTFQGLADLTRREMDYRRTMFLMSTPSYPDPRGVGTTVTSFLPYPTDDSQWAYNFDFQGPLNLFGREHRLMVGASGWDRERRINERLIDVSGQPSSAFAASYPALAGPGWSLPYPSWRTGFARSRQYTEQHGLFAAARWNLADSLKLITGVRVTHWKTSTDQFNGTTGALTRANTSAYSVRREVTPYVGAVWDFHPNFSAYASYADIFKPQNLYDSRDTLLEPVVGKNYEAGVKGELLEGRVNASAAVFRVVQDNLGERDPNFPDLYLTPGGNIPYRSAGRGITTQGFEAEVSGSPAAGWNLSAGYTYARSRNAKGETFDADQPEHLLRVFTTYRLQGDWSRLTVGAGLNWNSAISRVMQRPTGAYRPNGQPVTADHEFRQGSVWRLSAMARYQFTPSLSLLLNVDNLLDKKYYNSSASWAPLAYYGQPRRWRATLKYQY